MTNVDWIAAEEFFLEAAQRTYAADVPEVKNPNVSGERGYRYERGELSYLDRYTVGTNGWSFGQTIIWQEDQPIWWMHYHGRARMPAVTGFLKDALMAAYVEGRFIGGRGPFAFHRAEISPSLYLNRPRPSSTFVDFAGREEIIAAATTCDERAILFWHEYRGSALV